MKSKFKSLAGVLVLMLAIDACKPDYSVESTDSIENSPKPVLVEKLEVEKAPIPIQASGILSSKAETRLSFKTGGIIRRINSDEGQRVRKGQVLASLNMIEINAQVKKAQNGVDKAQRDLDRIKNLYKEDVATLEQLQDLTTVFDVATAELRIAQFNQQYSQIKAPSDGRILKRFAEQGELINSGSPAFLFAGYGEESFIIRIGLADRDIILLQQGDSAHIRFDAYPAVVFPARVTEVAQAADPRTGTFEIELTMHPTSFNLKNGFVGKVAVFPSLQNPYFKVSIEALVEANKEEVKVFLYDSITRSVQKIALVPDQIGHDYFTVLAKPGVASISVITKGAAYLKDGQKVQPSTFTL